MMSRMFAGCKMSSLGKGWLGPWGKDCEQVDSTMLSLRIWWGTANIMGLSCPEWHWQLWQEKEKNCVLDQHEYTWPSMWP